jgi:phosphate starvation-inducible PhoH-like protein
MHEETIYFDSYETINALLASEVNNNLAKLEQLFHTKIISRDLWIKVSSDYNEHTKNTISVLDELSNRYALIGKPLTQFDFDQIIIAYKKDTVNELHSLVSERIKVSPKKDDIIPRNSRQLEYIKKIKNKDIVFGIGPAGTGKTYLAMALAISGFLAGEYSRIILTRPAKEAGENLGFLPGSLEEKIFPYLRPLYDALYDMLEVEEAKALISSNIIELAPLAFMRGRTLNHAFIILDEAQNTTSEQMLMFLTRLGFGSSCVITGDPSQTDLNSRDISGLLHARKTLQNIPEIAFCEFTVKDVVRHSLVEKIINAYQSNKELKK